MLTLAMATLEQNLTDSLYILKGTGTCHAEQWPSSPSKIVAPSVSCQSGCLKHLEAEGFIVLLLPKAIECFL